MADSHMVASSSSSFQAEPLPSKSKIAELRSQILIGDLPDDFLRLCQPAQEMGEEVASAQPHHYPAPVAESVDSQQQTAYMPQMVSPAEQFYAFVPPHTRGRIAIKVVEAKLTKNYGLVRMDPYVRVRVGNTLFETPTSVNGGKAPSWNRTVNAYLPNEVESIYIQIYDERAFTNDECVAWAHVLLPEGIFSNEVIDDWYSLSGPQGDGKEGVINLVMSFASIESVPQPRPMEPSQPLQIQQIEAIGGVTRPLFTEEELDELHVMFPSIDKEVIRHVLEAKRGDKDSTVTALLEMAS